MEDIRSVEAEYWGQQTGFVSLTLFLSQETISDAHLSPKEHLSSPHCAADQQLDQKGGREPAKEVRGDQPQAESAEQQRSASPNVQPSTDSPQLQAERPQPQPNTLLTTETPADTQTVQ